MQWKRTANLVGLDRELVERELNSRFPTAQLPADIEVLGKGDASHVEVSVTAQGLERVLRAYPEDFAGRSSNPKLAAIVAAITNIIEAKNLKQKPAPELRLPTAPDMR